MKTGTKEELFGTMGIVAIENTADPAVWKGYEDGEFDFNTVSAKPVLVATPWQIRKALNATRLRDAVEAAVAAGSQDMKDGWEFATEIRRDDPLVITMGEVLGKTSKELDDLFTLAITL